mgnify:CR=1 FL=1
MAHIKNMSNRAYISSSLKNKLSRFEMYRYSFIYAPTGYGKSKITKSFFKNYPGYTVLWIDAQSSREIFWENFCNAVKLFNVSLAESFKNNFSLYHRFASFIRCVNLSVTTGVVSPPLARGGYAEKLFL